MTRTTMCPSLHSTEHASSPELNSPMSILFPSPPPHSSTLTVQEAQLICWRGHCFPPPPLLASSIHLSLACLLSHAQLFRCCSLPLCLSPSLTAARDHTAGHMPLDPSRDRSSSVCLFACPSQKATVALFRCRNTRDPIGVIVRSPYSPCVYGLHLCLASASCCASIAAGLRCGDPCFAVCRLPLLRVVSLSLCTTVLRRAYPSPHRAAAALLQREGGREADSLRQ